MLYTLLVITGIVIFLFIALLIVINILKDSSIVELKKGLLSVNDIGYIINNDSKNGIDILKQYHDWKFRFIITIMTFFTSLLVALSILLIRDFDSFDSEGVVVFISVIIVIISIITYLLIQLNSIPNKFVKNFRSFYELKEDLGI